FAPLNGSSYLRGSHASVGGDTVSLRGGILFSGGVGSLVVEPLRRINWLGAIYVQIRKVNSQLHTWLAPGGLRLDVHSPIPCPRKRPKLPGQSPRVTSRLVGRVSKASGQLIGRIFPACQQVGLAVGEQDVDHRHHSARNDDDVAYLERSNLSGTKLDHLGPL